MKFYRQRFNVNLTNFTGDRGKWLVRGLLLTIQVCAHFTGEMDTGIFVVLPFHRRKLVRDFGGEDMTKSLRIFSKLSIDLVCLYQLPFKLS